LQLHLPFDSPLHLRLDLCALCCRCPFLLTHMHLSPNLPIHLMLHLSTLLPLLTVSAFLLVLLLPPHHARHFRMRHFARQLVGRLLSRLLHIMKPTNRPTAESISHI